MRPLVLLVAAVPVPVASDTILLTLIHAFICEPALPFDGSLAKLNCQTCQRHTFCDLLAWYTLTQGASVAVKFTVTDYLDLQVSYTRLYCLYGACVACVYTGTQSLQFSGGNSLCTLLLSLSLAKQLWNEDEFTICT